MQVAGISIKGEDLILHTSHKDALQFAITNDPFKEGEYEIKRVRKRRSLDANAYLWVLCTKIAEAAEVSKEEVYRRNIRDGGEYTPLPIKEEAVEDFTRIWEAHGIGWFCDLVGNSKIPGYKLLFAYHGSSEYDSKQMYLLIERVKQDAESVGVETMTPEQLAALIKEWEAREANG
jgi:Ni,Fe-hydrogenase III component G